MIPMVISPRAMVCSICGRSGRLRVGFEVASSLSPPRVSEALGLPDGPR